MTDDHNGGHDSHDDHEHEDHGGVRLFLMVFGALCVLTTISFAVANTEAIMSNALTGWTVMMAVSCMKAMLVMTYFMHLKWEANWKYVLTIPASIMSIFLVLMLVPDVGRRTNRYQAERWLHAAEPEDAADAHGGHKDDHSDEKEAH